MAAVTAVKRLAEASAPWAVPMHCLVEFASVVTHPRIWKTPSSATDVESQVSAWLESPSVSVLGEERDFWPVFATCLQQARTAGGAVHDTRIATCCQYHGVRELWTADRDFSRYPWLRTQNPLV
jgi:uncharacterized protein